MFQAHLLSGKQISKIDKSRRVNFQLTEQLGASMFCAHVGLVQAW